MSPSIKIPENYTKIHVYFLKFFMIFMLNQENVQGFLLCAIYENIVSCLQDVFSKSLRSLKTSVKREKITSHFQSRIMSDRSDSGFCLFNIFTRFGNEGIVSDVIIQGFFYNIMILYIFKAKRLHILIATQLLFLGGTFYYLQKRSLKTYPMIEKYIRIAKRKEKRLLSLLDLPDVSRCTFGRLHYIQPIERDCIEGFSLNQEFLFLEEEDRKILQTIMTIVILYPVFLFRADIQKFTSSDITKNIFSMKVLLDTAGSFQMSVKRIIDKRIRNRITHEAQLHDKKVNNVYPFSKAGKLIKIIDSCNKNTLPSMVRENIESYWSTGRFFGKTGKISIVFERTEPFSQKRMQKYIVGQEKYDSERYKKVLEVVGLKKKLIGLKKREYSNAIISEDPEIEWMATIAKGIYKNAEIYVFVHLFDVPLFKHSKTVGLNILTDFLKGKTCIVIGTANICDKKFDSVLRCKEKKVYTTEIEEKEIEERQLAKMKNKSTKETETNSKPEFDMTYDIICMMTEGTFIQKAIHFFKNYEAFFHLILYLAFRTFFLMVYFDTKVELPKTIKAIIVVLISAGNYSSWNQGQKHLLKKTIEAEKVYIKERLEKLIRVKSINKQMVFSCLRKERMFLSGKEQASILTRIESTLGIMTTIIVSFVKMGKHSIISIVVFLIIALFFPIVLRRMFLRKLERLIKRGVNGFIKMDEYYIEGYLLGQREREELFLEKFKKETSKLFRSKRNYSVIRAIIILGFSSTYFVFLYILFEYLGLLKQGCTSAIVIASTTVLLKNFIILVFEYFMRLTKREEYLSISKRRRVSIDTGSIEIRKVRCIEFREVNYSILGRLVLKDFSIKIGNEHLTRCIFSKKEKLDVFIKLVLGLTKPEKGIILLDGFPIEAVSEKTLRERIGIVWGRGDYIGQSVRECIDPKGLYEDKKIKNLIKELPLGMLFEEKKINLNSPIWGEGGNITFYEQILLQIGYYIMYKQTIILLMDVYSGLNYKESSSLRSVTEEFFDDVGIVSLEIQ
eukprot:GHVP01062029.1.p1 GENE.GHVP01062029.1~~GHVP01062029.1.p1  ORF type:complete len:1015 (+),score=155.40 GHVP01062029.1:120-3164(+)